MIRVAINGARGRMGSAITALLPITGKAYLVQAYDRPTSPDLGKDIGTIATGTANGVTLEASDCMTTGKFDVLIDFSSPESAISALKVCAESRKAVIIGVTGFSDSQQDMISALGTEIPIVYSPNMSLGVNLCFGLIRNAAATIGGNADIDVCETHHRHKKDAPSGTALKMGNIIADTLGLDMKSAMMFPVAGPRSGNKIGFQVARSGDTVGEHTVTFTLDGERVEITHRAFNRTAFAHGAVAAAVWVHGKPANLYGMDAVVGQ